MSTSIREAEFGDVVSILDLVKQCIEGMRGIGIEQWDELYPDRQTLMADIAARTAFVAIHAERAVGVIVLNEIQEHEYASVLWQHSGRTAVIHRLAVAPPWEGHGIGRALMRFAERRASALGYDSIRLDAYCGNPRALRFYARSGYSRVGKVRFRKGHFDCFEKLLRAG